MKILVLGAAGGVGRLVVKQALAHGNKVTAFVRDSGNAFLDGATIVHGDVLDNQALSDALLGQDAVVYAIGVKSTGPTTLFSQSTRRLLAAMEQQQVKRLVCITGVGAGETKGHGGFLYDRFIFPLFTKNRYGDKELQEQLIRQSNLDWTIVRPAPFSEGKPSAPFQVLTEVGNAVLRKVSRAEVAAFVLEELGTRKYLRKTLFIGHKN
ncbi:MAG: SDR family oxidoreductase [Bryobacteraceae bacterium]